MMTPASLQRLKSLFARSIGLDNAARAALLEEAGREDPALRDELEPCCAPTPAATRRCATPSSRRRQP